jgi:hypothetical protein
MKGFAKQHNFSIPYVADETQDVARAYDAICTPISSASTPTWSCSTGGQLDASRTTLVPDARR